MFSTDLINSILEVGTSIDAVNFSIQKPYVRHAAYLMQIVSDVNRHAKVPRLTLDNLGPAVNINFGVYTPSQRNSSSGNLDYFQLYFSDVSI